MLLVNTDFITGKELETLGIVKGKRRPVQKRGTRLLWQVSKLWWAEN